MLATPGIALISIAVSRISVILPSMQCLETPDPRLIRPMLRSACILYCAIAIIFSCAGNVFAAARKASGTARVVDSYTITQRDELCRINISYPNVGTPVADAELAIWARDLAAKFAESVRQISMPMPVPYELDVTYETLRASSSTLSVVFFISTSMGNPHPERGLATFIYDKRDGRRLSYRDIFLHREGLLEMLSERCKAELSANLGEKLVPDMLEAGTAPEEANFDLFALTASGLRVYFPPYQAAPYSEGYLSVAIPLVELEAFKPQRSFWDKE